MTRLFFALCCTLSLASCGRIETTRQCRALANLVNPQLDSIEYVSRTHKIEPATLEDIARRYKALEAALVQIHFTDPLLTAGLGEYRRTLTRAAELLNSIAQAQRAGDVVRTQQEQTELERLSHRERLQVSQLGSSCHS